MAYAVFDVAGVSERRKAVARELGAAAIRMNQFDNQPGEAGKEHDEAESAQEEIYVALRGSGSLVVDGEEVPFAPGRYVLVSPDARRRVVAGAAGLTYVVVGAET